MTLEPIKMPEILPYDERVKICKSDAVQHFTNRNDVYKAVDKERIYQDNKHGTIENHPHSVGEWLLIIEDELQEAKNGWCREHSDARALEEILQVISTGVACLEQHGIVERKNLCPMKVGVVGYSGRKFDIEKAKMLIDQAFDQLSALFPNMTIVSGLTDLGIPALAYREAVSRGFKTVGIACEKAKNHKCFNCDEVIIEGKEWGDESQKFLESINILIRIGGGKQSLEEVAKAKKPPFSMPVMEYELEEIKE